MLAQFAEEAKPVSEPYSTYGECGLELLTKKCATYVSLAYLTVARMSSSLTKIYSSLPTFTSVVL